MECEGVDWIQVAQYGFSGETHRHRNECSGSIKGCEFLNQPLKDSTSWS